MCLCRFVRLVSPCTLALTWLASITRVVAGSVTLAWDADSDPSVVGYRLHSGTTSGVYTQTTEVGSALSVSVSNLAGGKTYFFVVTAYNAAVVESGPSNEVSYLAPTPSPTPTPTPSPTPTPTPSPTPTPTISLSASPTLVSKGSSATYTVSASNINPSQPVIVTYKMGGNAKLGINYTLSDTSGQITIPAGASTATVTLNALQNNVTRTKTALMQLNSGPGYQLSSSNKATVTITP